MHPLLAIFHDAAAGNFPDVDGRVTHLPGLGDGWEAVVCFTGHAFIARNSQDAVNAFRPYFEDSPIYGKSYQLEDFMHGTPMSVGSPQEVIEKTLTFQEGFGDYQRQLWNVDAVGLPVEMALEQVELLGTEVVPVLDASGLFGPVETAQFSFVQMRERDALLDLVLSRSYLAKLPPAEREPVLDAVGRLYDETAGPEGVRLPYVTECFRAQRR